MKNGNKTKTPTIAVLIVVFSLMCICSTYAQEIVNDRGAIGGRVTLSNKGVAGVPVTISERRDAFGSATLITTAKTDIDGRFRFPDLSPGTYYLQAFAPTFVVTETNGGYPPGHEVTIKRGDVAENIDFSLVRGGVISGRVRDSSGRPIVDETVRIRSVDRELDRLVPGINENAQIRTDDRGIYRAYGLPPGKYKVSVGQRFAAYTSTAGRRVYSETLYPNVTDEEKAESVEVSQGSEANNIDITVARPLAGFLASGRFVDAESGEAVPNVSFGLNIVKNGQPSGSVSGIGISAPNGDFQIDNLAPGRYVISVVSSSGSGYYGESEAFDVIDDDVTDLSARIHRGATIAGKIVFEGSSDSSIQQGFARAQLEVLVRGEGNFRNAASFNAINPDGTFLIGPVQAGTALITLGSIDKAAPTNLRMMSIDLNGVDQSRGVHLTAGENVSGLRIVAGSGTGIISGNVRLQGGVLSPDIPITAWLVRSGAPFVIARVRVDSRGHFSFSRIPPGNYEIIVQVFSESLKVPPTKQAVSVSDGLTSEVSIILNPDVNPVK